MNYEQPQRPSTQISPKVKLWRFLSGPEVRSGLFNRNISLGSFVVDFFSDELQLIIEIDGGHQVSQLNYFIQKNRFFALMNYHVLRFRDFDVLYRFDDFCFDILDQVERLTPLLPQAQKKAPDHF